jgi:DNA polymerase-3 subunit beta
VAQVQLTTSDLEIQIRTTADVDGDAGSFTTTVGARKLIDILRTMPRPDRQPGVQRRTS